jgi:hypothetical protein
LSSDEYEERAGEGLDVHRTCGNTLAVLVRELLNQLVFLQQQQAAEPPLGEF